MLPGRHLLAVTCGLLAGACGGNEPACDAGYVFDDLAGACAHEAVSLNETVLLVEFAVAEGEEMAADSVSINWSTSQPRLDSGFDDWSPERAYPIRRMVRTGDTLIVDLGVRPAGLDTVIAVSGLAVASGSSRTHTVLVPGRTVRVVGPVSGSGTNRLTVRSDPPGASFVIQDLPGNAVTSGVAPGTFDLEPGEYIVRATVDGRGERSARVDLRRGNRVEVLTFSDEMRRVNIATEPGDALVRLFRRNADGSEELVGERQSPAAFTVAGGIYGYEVTKPGYQTATPGMAVLDTRTGDVSTTVELVSEDVARTLGGVRSAACEEVIRTMQSLNAPTDTRGEAGYQWASALQRYGDCLANEGEYDQALEAADRILGFNPAFVTARELKGQILCGLGDFAGGYRELQEASGPGAAQVPVGDRFAFRTIVQFRVARCKVDEYRADTSENRGVLRTAARAALAQFLAEAEEELGRRVASPTILEQLSSLRSEAEQLLQSL